MGLQLIRFESLFLEGTFFLIWLLPPPPPPILGRRIFEQNLLFTTENIVCFQENFQNFNHWKYCMFFQQNFTTEKIVYISPLKILYVFPTKLHHWKYCMFFNVAFAPWPPYPFGVEDFRTKVSSHHWKYCMFSRKFWKFSWKHAIFSVVKSKFFSKILRPPNGGGGRVEVKLPF